MFKGYKIPLNTRSILETLEIVSTPQVQGGKDTDVSDVCTPTPSIGCGQSLKGLSSGTSKSTFSFFFFSSILCFRISSCSETLVYCLGISLWSLRNHVNISIILCEIKLQIPGITWRARLIFIVCLLIMSKGTGLHIWRQRPYERVHFHYLTLFHRTSL